MKMLDKFKNLFAEKKEPDIQEATVHSSISPAAPLGNISYTRNDGTSIIIQPQADKLGNQIFEQIFNTRTHQFKVLPRYIIMCPELSEICKSNILSKSILLDIDPKNLENPVFLDAVANGLLNRTRLKKVINQYHGYAGGLSLDANGFPCGKYVDAGILEALSANKEIQEKMMQEERARREVLDRIEIMEKASNLNVHYKYPDER